MGPNAFFTNLDYAEEIYSVLYYVLLILSQVQQLDSNFTLQRFQAHYLFQHSLSDAHSDSIILTIIFSDLSSDIHILSIKYI